MDQVIHNKIVSFICGMETNLGSRSYLTPNRRTLSANPRGVSTLDGDDYTRTRT